MLTIISDTSPLITLAAVEQLDLLPQLYQELIIPEAVANELAQGQGKPGFRDFRHFAWLNLRQAHNQALVQQLRQSLDPGEAEAIALALELKADYLLIDELLGRKTARRYGIQVIGVIGVIILAKRHGLLPLVKPLIEEMVRVSGFRISPHLVAQVLRSVGE